MVEEDETHSAYICSSGKVYYSWRKPGKMWQIELVESFPPESINRVEIERSPEGTVWLAVLHADVFYLYELTPDGWNDYIVDVQPSQQKEQVRWRFEIDWDNQLQLVRQISPIGFRHLTGTPGNWTTAIINNIEKLGYNSTGFTMTGMEMRKDNTPVIYLTGTGIEGQSVTAAIFNNQNDWEAAISWGYDPGLLAYDHARDRIHWVRLFESMYLKHDSIPLGQDSRMAYKSETVHFFDGVKALTVGKLDLPHFVTIDSGEYFYERPVADIFTHIEERYSSDPSEITYMSSVVNWKWNRSARLAFVMEIAGQYYWWPDWTGRPVFVPIEFGTGGTMKEMLRTPVLDGEHFTDVTFYTGLLDPEYDVLLNGACWDMHTISFRW